MDGGDFVGTCAYTLEPRGPLRWLDPGAFGTLGVGAGPRATRLSAARFDHPRRGLTTRVDRKGPPLPGFAMGAALARPAAPVWVFYGDGALGFSLAEIDTLVRARLGVVCVVGNDAGWTQARDF